MVIMVTGVLGQLGHDVINEAVKRGHKVFGTDTDIFYSKKPDGTMISRLPYCQMEASNLATVDRVIDSLRLDVVIHCSAFTDEWMPARSENHQKIIRTNVKGTENIAKTCNKFGMKMIYVSSDSGNDFDIVTENLDKYFIVRTQWLYGMAGENYVKEMLALGERSKSVRVVGDVTGTPTYTFDLARLLVDMAESEEYGIYDAVNEGGFISKAEFVREIYRRAGLKTKVISVKGETLSRTGNCFETAKCPAVAKLSTLKLKEHHFRRLPPWDGALGRFLKEIRYPTRIRGKLPEKDEISTLKCDDIQDIISE